MGALIKNNAVLVVYILGIVLGFMALGGKNKWAFLFVIALIPLRNVIDRLQAMPMGKDFLDIMFAFLIMGWFISASSSRQKLFSKSPINLAIFVLITYTLISTFIGSQYLGYRNVFDIADPRIQEWKNYILLPILFLITFNTVRDKKLVYQAIFVMCCTMVLMDTYVLRQITWYSSLVSRKKIGGTFVFLGPNEVAAFYNQYTILLMALYFHLKKTKLKWLLLGLIVVNLNCVLFLFSRAAYMATVTGMFFLFLMRKKALLIPLVLLGLFWTTILPQKVIQRIEMTTNEFGELDESAAMRLVVWERSLELFNENPITGVGFGVFANMGYELGDTHNIYLKILAEQGILGMFVFVSLLLCFFTQGVKLYKIGDDEISKGLGLGFALCIVVLIINNMFGDRWTYMEVSSNLWVFAGLVARLIVIAEDSRKKAAPAKPQKPNNPYARPVR